MRDDSKINTDSTYLAPISAAPKGNRPATAESIVAEIKNALGEAWLPLIYLRSILPLRTRSLQLPLQTAATSRRRAAIEVQHTLLGIELKIGRRRLLCPDLATARYLAVFARLNCPEIAVPYDISRISRLADDLESAWHRMLILVAHFAEGRSQAFHSRVRAAITSEARQEIITAGAGPPIPQFNQNTKQRRRSA